MVPRRRGNERGRMCQTREADSNDPPPHQRTILRTVVMATLIVLSPTLAPPLFPVLVADPAVYQARGAVPHTPGLPLGSSASPEAAAFWQWPTHADGEWAYGQHACLRPTQSACQCALQAPGSSRQPPET